MMVAALCRNLDKGIICADIRSIGVGFVDIRHIGIADEFRKQISVLKESLI